MTMHPQLKEIADEFVEASERLERLTSDLPDSLWSVRPRPESWSVGECVAHLNVTARSFLPELRTALDEARALNQPAPRRYRRDPIGWLLWRTQGPPVRMKLKTTASFVPEGAAEPAALRAEFARLQAEQLECVQEADGLPIQKVKIVSPFDSRVRYNLFATLSVLARHEHRHLWQAEQAARAVAASGAAGAGAT